MEGQKQNNYALQFSRKPLSKTGGLFLSAEQCHWDEYLCHHIHHAFMGQTPKGYHGVPVIVEHSLIFYPRTTIPWLLLAAAQCGLLTFTSFQF